jgi:hypothetical protein
MVESAENVLQNIKGLKPSVDQLNFTIKTPEEIFKLSQQNKNNLYVVF